MSRIIELSLIGFFLFFNAYSKNTRNSHNTDTAVMSSDTAEIGIVSVDQIAQLTGQNSINHTDQVNVYGTDLGSMFLHSNGKIYFLFGDTFGAPGMPGSPDWRSNTMAYTTDFKAVDGIRFHGWITNSQGEARALVSGNHDPNDGSGEITKIPTAGWSHNCRQYMWFMSVNQWGTHGQWVTNYSEIAYSDDHGNSWELSGTRWAGNSNFTQVAVVDSGYLYFWGIPAGRFGGVKLARVSQTDALDKTAYRYYDGTSWSGNEADAALIVEPPVGELSVLYNPFLQRWIMMYLNENTASIELRHARLAQGPWSAPVEVVRADDYPALYGAYMHSLYTEKNGETVYFLMSQFGYYNVFLMRLKLQSPHEELFYDFGDIAGNPDLPSYNTFRTLVNYDGARHKIDSDIYMGSCIDAEADGQPTAHADGDDKLDHDDEDGVVLASSCFHGESTAVEIVVSADGYISAWTIWGNGNVDIPNFMPTIEEVFIDEPVSQGYNTLLLQVPDYALPGKHAIRFRYCTQPGIRSFGPAPDGEVEDHILTVECNYEYDYGDLPAGSFPDPQDRYPTVERHDGAAHKVVQSVCLGKYIDTDRDGWPHDEALGDDEDGIDDEDGVVLHPMPGTMDKIGFTVTASVEGYLNAWVDWNSNKNLNDTFDQICADRYLYRGKNRMVITVPSGASEGPLYARFRFNSNGGLTWCYKAEDGEVEDYVLYLNDQTADKWRVPIRVYVEGQHIEQTFGVHPNGTDDFDSGLDEPTPAPPPQTGSSYFQSPVDPQGLHLQTDIRAPWFDSQNNTITWTLFSDTEETILLTWEPSALPSQGLFLMQSENAMESINMRRQDVVEVAGGQTVQISSSIKTNVGMDFTRQGWHMVSLPVLPDSNRVDELFPNLSDDFAYAWNPVEEDYERVTHLQSGQGYWLIVEDSASLLISGEAVDFFHLTLQTGWNMIGAPFDVGAVEAKPQEAISYQFIEWDEANRSYRTAQKLLASRAYWVWADSDCELIGYSKDISNASGLNKFSQPSQQRTPPPPPYSFTGVESETFQPRAFRVMQNYPNPFNPTTLLSYQLDRDGYVEISVFNLQGVRIKTLHRGFQRAGEHRISWDGCDKKNAGVASGLYLIRVKTRNHEKTIKAMRLK